MKPSDQIMSSKLYRRNSDFVGWIPDKNRNHHILHNKLKKAWWWMLMDSHAYLSGEIPSILLKGA
ncbi:hypothetical protein D1B31_20175 [Neobacillus notoginsengisoli]|uniref:Uncharacterized protein n=1 Tax=Neobacillus notoginsengisoli TaxID=1578198 RepID=A0A417YKT3_9BACI|nr:hypothetical protein D1B31_20175 [Neobacillus notoginsengisoli]